MKLKNIDGLFGLVIFFVIVRMLVLKLLLFLVAVVRVVIVGIEKNETVELAHVNFFGRMSNDGI